MAVDNCGTTRTLTSCGTCSTGYTCSVAGQCLSSTPVCGDGSCTGSETCSTCSADCGSCSTSYLRTFYVSSSTGNDNNDGLTQSTPWKTLQYAESQAMTPGNILALKRGDVWSFDNVFEINKGGTIGNPIVWDGNLWGTGAKAIIQANSDGGSVPKYYSLVHIAGCHDVTFQNITVNVQNHKRFGIVIGGDYQFDGPTKQDRESNIIIQDSNLLNCGDGTDYEVCLLVRTWNSDTSKNNITNITIRRNYIDGASNHDIAFYPGKTQDGATPGFIKDCYIGYNTITNFGKKNDGVYTGIMINNGERNIVVEHNNITTGVYGNGFGMAIDNNEQNTGYFPTGIIVRYNDIRMRDNSALFIEHGQAMTANIYSNNFYTSAANSGGGTIWIANNGVYTGASFNIYNNVLGTGTGRCFTDSSGIKGVVIQSNNTFIPSSCGP